MKTIDELYSEVLKDEKLRIEFLEIATKKDGIKEFLKKHDCHATDQDLIEYFKKKRNISDEEMKLISGGKGFDIGEAMISCLTVGIGCVLRAISSGTMHDCGTAIKGKGMLCGADTCRY